ncbi:hypothetical protein KXT45_23615, partial [Salmonella enterica subsp. enterica serovar Weltevreden]|nr:hypothetical protein [Salmonella enterica subsp. enterica serovar Weltevreden]
AVPGQQSIINHISLHLNLQMWSFRVSQSHGAADAPLYQALYQAFLISGSLAHNILNNKKFQSASKAY